MGGGEKGLESPGGQPLLAHVIDGLAPQVGAGGSLDPFLNVNSRADLAFAETLVCELKR